MHTVKLLEHQALLVQSPFVNSDIRFHFLIAGYASGKTSGLVYAILHTVKNLLGKKDEEGHNPKILVASKNLTFMKKTLTGLLEQDLRMTCSEYTYDKAHNIITIGNVELLLIPDEDESSIYGFSCYCFKGDTLVATSEGDKRIDEIKAGDLVLTRKGFKKVTHAWCSGVKDCIELTMDNGNHIVCTPDHRFITAQEEEIEVKDITPATDLLHYVTMKDGSVFLELGHVKHIESGIEKQKVYDIEVEDEHEFFANGYLVHNCSFVDELDELDTQTAMAVVKSINDRTRQQIEGMRSCFIMFTTSSQGLKGTYQTVMHFNKSNIGYVLIRARTKDNIYLPPDYIKNMYSIYNEKERDCLLEGKFVSIDSGLIFPDYDPKNNKLDNDLYDFVRNNPEYTIYIGQDFNSFGNNAVSFTVLENSIIAIKDYEFPDIRRAPEVFRYDFPENRIVWVPDMTYKEHFSEFKKELRIFKIDLALRSCNPLVGDRNFACNKLFVAQRLFICPMCKGLETTLLTWQKDPRTGQPYKGGKGAPDHKGDCLGYVVHYLLSWKKELKYLYRVTLQRLYDARRARGTQATELEIDSHEINWDKLSFTKLKEAPNVVNNGD